MEIKYNIMTFSDVQIPSYNRPYRGVLFIDFLVGKFNNVYVISPETKENFKNQWFNQINYYYKNGKFKENQYNIFFRLYSIFKLTIFLFKFRLSNCNKIDFIRTGSTYLSFLLKITQKKSTPYFADICDFYFELYEEFNMPFAKILKPIIFWFEKISVKRANLIFVDTSAQRDFMVSKMGISKNNCVVVPNGILLDDFKFLLEKNQEVLKEYGFTLEDKILFYGGDISEMDGIEYIIKYVRENIGIKALIIGKGNKNYINKLKDIINQYGLQKSIIIDSFKPYSELYKYISIADVCLAPFKITFTSNTVECGKIITYLLGGKKVLATKADGIYSLYGNNINYFVDGNFVDFSLKLDGLLNSNFNQENKLNLRNFAEKFNFKNIIDYEYKVINKYFENPNQDFTKYDYFINK